MIGNALQEILMNLLTIVPFDVVLDPSMFQCLRSIHASFGFHVQHVNDEILGIVLALPNGVRKIQNGFSKDGCQIMFVMKWLFARNEDITNDTNGPTITLKGWISQQCFRCLGIMIFEKTTILSGILSFVIMQSKIDQLQIARITGRKTDAAFRTQIAVNDTVIVHVPNDGKQFENQTSHLSLIVMIVMWTPNGFAITFF
mmetsp:Transcript_16244/g.37307  ORF Transcript_16244/g.37307 Transcript_16244/m.37307 type:complete len:200 (-) Transcript_16244:570-1169(-)